MRAPWHRVQVNRSGEVGRALLLLSTVAACAGRAGPKPDTVPDAPVEERRDGASQSPRDGAGESSRDAAGQSPRDAAPSPGDAPAADARTAGARDPFLWPFASESIWNMPIGSGAVWKPARLEAAKHVGVDTQHILALSAASPLRPVYAAGPFAGPRCAGQTELPLSFRVPDDWLVPDAGQGNPYGLTPNSNFAFLLEDGETLFEGSLISRCQRGGPIYLPDWIKWPNNQARQSVRGDALKNGGQGASRMSTMGGTVRLHDIADDGPIRHAIKINPWAKKYLHHSAEVPGFRWPAKAADSYASKPGEYDPASFGRADDPSLVMGTLLAIPPQVTEASLGLTTAAGRKFFRVMQDYGVYFAEDAAWDTWDVVVERGAEVMFTNKYGFSMTSATFRDELNKLMRALEIVDNNGPTSVGGGGTPRVQKAPPF